jgi:hypothetical protein
MRTAPLSALFLLIVAGPLLAAQQRINVSDDAGLRRALGQATAGTRIIIAPGEYRPNIHVRGLRGTAEAPIIIEGADPGNKPLFRGGATAIHISSSTHLVLRNISARGQNMNGINIDDGGRAGSSSHITLEGLHIAETGPGNNRDCIKLSGVSDLVVRNCIVEEWTGEGIDMVGCHRVLIENCTLRNKASANRGAGVQAKGGSSEVLIRNCTFLNGGGRAVSIGGSTGMRYFRPLGAGYEARDITVEGCRFVDSLCPVAFVGVDGAVFRYNTIVRPQRWIVRILQETTAPEFVACRNGRFERNLIVYQRRQVGMIVNVGTGTDPASFRFIDNFWFCEDQPGQAPPRLPVPEQGGVWGIDPKLGFTPDGAPAAPATPAARGFGADALPRPPAL